MLEVRSLSKSFGGIPGEIQPYGFASLDANGSMYTVVNPAQAVNRIELRVQFAFAVDSGATLLGRYFRSGRPHHIF